MRLRSKDIRYCAKKFISFIFTVLLSLGAVTGTAAPDRFPVGVAANRTRFDNPCWGILMTWLSHRSWDLSSWKSGGFNTGLTYNKIKLQRKFLAPIFICKLSNRWSQVSCALHIVNRFHVRTNDNQVWSRLRKHTYEDGHKCDASVSISVFAVDVQKTKRKLHRLRWHLRSLWQRLMPAHPFQQLSSPVFPRMLLFL